MLVIGAKGFAIEVLEVLHQLDKDQELVFFDNINLNIHHVFNQFKVIHSFDEAEDYFKLTDSNFTIGIGGPQNRYELYNKFTKIGGKFVSTISPFSRIGHFENEINFGCNIMTGTIITNHVKIGIGNLINLNCTIGHDTVMGDFNELSPGVHISGNCKIGNYCNIGTNATILPKISLGDNVIVGAGAVVTKDILSNTLVAGVPAKTLRALPPMPI